jgi:hypothetical protein
MQSRQLPARALAVPLLVLALAGCDRGIADRARATPAPSTPSASPTPDPARPEPFSLVIEHIEMAPMGNGEILGVAGQPVRPEVAERAVRATREALERYLTAQFADPDTRFTPAPARALLPAGRFDALTPEHRQSLGHLELPAVGIVTGPARGTATVLFEGERVHAVAIEYTARATLVFWDDTEGAITQRGSVVFTSPHWAVDSFDLTLDAPPLPSRSPSPSPDASAGASPATSAPTSTEAAA